MVIISVSNYYDGLPTISLDNIVHHDIAEHVVQMVSNSDAIYSSNDNDLILCYRVFLYRCLSKTSGALQLKTSTVCKVILACAVLHNIAMRGELNVPDPEVGPGDQAAADIGDNIDDNPGVGNAAGFRARRELIERHFT